MSSPFATDAPRPLQPSTESLIKILSLISSAVTVDGKLRVYIPGGITPAWGTITGDIVDQVDLTAYVQSEIASALSTVVEKKGGIDCSTNPNFPAASNSDLYFVTHAGKIGGPAGQDVSVGDTMIAIADTPAGSQAAVGANWIVLNTNIPGLTTLGIAFATMANPAVDSFPKIKPDGTIEMVAVTAMGGGADLQEVWMNTGI